MYFYFFVKDKYFYYSFEVYDCNFERKIKRRKYKIRVD